MGDVFISSSVAIYTRTPCYICGAYCGGYRCSVQQEQYCVQTNTNESRNERAVFISHFRAQRLDFAGREGLTPVACCVAEQQVEFFLRR